MTTACRESGAARATVYVWQEHDDQFAHDFRQAEIEATEVMEQEARRRAVEGTHEETPIMHRGAIVGTVKVTRYSDTLLIFLLKARAPEKYRDRYDVTTGGQPLIAAHADLDDAIEQRLAFLAARGEGPSALAPVGEADTEDPAR